MVRAENGLIKKLLTTSILAGTLFFNSFNNSANAQDDNYTPKYNTTTHQIIKEIQKENAFIEPKTLDNIIDQSKKIIKENYEGDAYNTENAKELIEKINSEIIEKYPELNKDQQCYFKSLTYLAIAEKNNLPLHIVNVPGHIFIRWDPDGNHMYRETNGEQTAMFALFTGKLPKKFSEEERTEAEKLNKGDFNWDPNFLEFYEDQEYFMKFPFPQEMIEKVWLKNLNKKETLAISYKQEAVLLKNSEKYQKALECINKSLNLDTSKWEIYAVKGSILSKIGEKECEGKELSQKCGQFFLESNKNYEKAIKMANSKDLSNLGKNFYFLKDYQKSEECFNKTLEVFKNDALLHLKRAKFYHLIGQEEKAIDDLFLTLNIHGGKIVRSGNEFIQIEFLEDIIRSYDKNKEISFKETVGKKILDWNNAKKSCELINENVKENYEWRIKYNIKYASNLSLPSLENFWKLPSIKELDDIYKAYKDVKVPEYKNWYSEYGVDYKYWRDFKYKKSPDKDMYWSLDEDDKKVFIKSFKEDSIKKINKNPHYWKFEDVNIYHDISCMCIKNLDKRKINEKALNVLKNLSWEDNNFYHLWYEMDLLK